MPPNDPVSPRLFVGSLVLHERLRDADNPCGSLINEVVPPHQQGHSPAK